MDLKKYTLNKKTNNGTSVVGVFPTREQAEEEFDKLYEEAKDSLTTDDYAIEIYSVKCGNQFKVSNENGEFVYCEIVE